MAGRASLAKVSILVPVCNVARYLPQCLDSLLAQTLRDIEIIAIDDGSTDSSPAILDRYASADSRVTVIHKSNSGYGDSLNQALSIARAPWIGICEPDDFVEPDMYEHLLREAERYSKPDRPIDLVKGSYTRIIEAESKQIRTLPTWTFNNIHPDRQPFGIDECPLFLTGHPSIWTALYRRAFLDEFGIRFLPIPGAGWADNPFFIETMVAARSIVYLDECVYNYREFEDGTISHLKDWRIITNRWTEMNEVLNRYDVEVPSIIEAHSCRGCAYLQMLHDDFEQTPELISEARKMAASLDFETISQSSLISKEYKLAYAAYLPASKKARLLVSWLALHVRAFTQQNVR